MSVRLAFHEAGHAVAAQVLGRRVKLVTILPTTPERLGFALVPLEDFSRQRSTPAAIARAERQAVILLAGPLADVRLVGHGRSPYDGDDVKQFNACVPFLNRGWGEAHERHLIEMLHARTKAILDSHWREVEYIAARLVIQRTIWTGEDWHAAWRAARVHAKAYRSEGERADAAARAMTADPTRE